MSEKASNPERELPKWFDNCNSCETKYQITNQNSMYVVFTEQQECNYLICKCTNCGLDTMIFDQEIDAVAAAERDIMIDDQSTVAPDIIYDKWLEVNQIELAREYELTPRHEEVIRKFGEAISATLDNDTEAWDYEMNQPNAYRPYPARWTS